MINLWRGQTAFGQGHNFIMMARLPEDGTRGLASLATTSWRQVVMDEPDEQTVLMRGVNSKSSGNDLTGL